MSKKIIFTIEEENEIINLWKNSDKSCVQIGKIFGVSETPIRRCLKAHNIEIKNKKQFVKIKHVDDNFFDNIDTEEKAYWLGFICADGYVAKNRVGIGLSAIDYNHLCKFKDLINSDTDIRKFTRDNKEYCDFRFTSQQMVKSLSKYSIVDNKTFKLDLSITLSFVPENLKRHFVRGYFDGDGTICQNSKTLQPAFNIILTEKNINPIMKEISLNTKPIKDKRKKDSWTIQSSNKDYIKNLYDYFYTNCNIYLDRKYIKFTEIKKYIEEAQRV